MFLFQQALWIAVTPSLQELGPRSSRSFLSMSPPPRPPPPPDITPCDDEEETLSAGPPISTQQEFTSKNTMSVHPRKRPIPRRRENRHTWDAARPKQADDVVGASWMDRNAQFSRVSSKTFRDDFRGTRVFIQGLSPHTSWQTLKDHCRSVAGNVVFASVSQEKEKGHGIVQFETVDEAAFAIQVLRNHPLDGQTLYARPDVQENKEQKRLSSTTTRATRWQCAHPEYEQPPAEVMDRVTTILQTRDAARRRRNYQAADVMRQQLRHEYSVQIDDRSQLWWINNDFKENRLPPWKHIQTGMDDAVDPAHITSLLEQRDRARQQRDFTAADSLLEQVANVQVEGNEHLSVRVHDESRTWRLWAAERPPSPRRQCLELVQLHDPTKVTQVHRLLERFPASDVLTQLQNRYSNKEK